MSYVDQYARIFREAADRQARTSGRTRLRLRAPRAGLVAAVAALAVIAVILPRLDIGERAASPPSTPAPPTDPRVSDVMDEVLNGDARREVPCRPPRRGAGVTDAPVGRVARETFGVLRRPGNAPPRILRSIRRGGDPRAEVLSESVRMLPYGSRRPLAVLFVQHGPAGRFVPRDPERCAELMQAELQKLAADEPQDVREGAARALAAHAADQARAVTDEQDRLYLFGLYKGEVSGGGGGATAEQLRQTGMGGSGTVRIKGRVSRVVNGLVPDGVAEIEIIAKGGGTRPWVKRHRVPVEDNYFHFEGFHAASFRSRWLDAAGKEVPKGSVQRP